MPRRSTRAPQVAILAAVLLTGSGAFIARPLPVAAATIADTFTSATAAPQVFSPNGDGIADTTTLHVMVARPSTVTVVILDYASKPVRTLLPATAEPVGALDVTWDGRGAKDAYVQNAGYRFRMTARNDLGTFTVDRPIVKALDAVYPINPGAITVAIDPGHGGADPGAIRPPLAEKTANLDIALRLRAMLLGAGVNVVMTRTSDTKVNRKGIDWTRDGKVAYRDELAARIEIANNARADVFMVLHNNGTAPGVGATETWYDATRTFTATNRMLATVVQASLVTALRTRATSSWAPRNRGIRVLDFYVLRKYKKRFDERPSLMPGILGESLAMGSRHELGMLRDGPSRQTIAEGYYEGLVRFFNARTWGARYDVLTAPPASTAEGSAASATVRVTNTSPTGWAAGAVSLTLSAVTAVPWYDGTNAPGARLATIPLPALAAGASTDVAVPFTTPSYASVAKQGGTTILKVDLLAGAYRLASAGVPPLQLWLTIVKSGPTPPPPPTPTPSPTPSASPSPTATPTPTSTPSPTPSPTPTATLTPSATPEPSASPSDEPSPSAS